MKRAPHPPPPPPPPRGRMREGMGRKAPPPPPPEDNAAGWGGRGRRVRDEPHDRARRGRAPCKPRRGDHRGCGRRIEGATEGATRLTPPPCRGTKATPRAYDARATAGKRQAPPPPTSLRPPKGGGCGKGRAGSGPPSPAGGGTGGEHAAWIGQRQGPRGVPHTPAGGQVPCRVPVPCLRRAYAGGRATRAHPPPPRPHLPHPPRTEARATGRWRGDKRDGGSGRRTPPPGTPRRGGETEGRDDRAQGGHAPCKPPRGDRRGCNRRKGRVTAGATRQPPPQRRDKCRASCLRRASDVLAQKGGQREPPPPRPLLRRPAAERARAARRQWKKKKKHKASNQGHQHAGAGTGSRGRRDMAGARGHSKGPGSAPLGMKEGEQGPTGGGGVTRAREQRW